MSRQPIQFVAEDQAYVFSCPHCLGSVVVHVSEVNCQIFRHAVLKNSGQQQQVNAQVNAQVNPHASKEELEYLVENDLVYGCGRPFRMFQENGVWSYVDVCDYI